MPDESVNVYLPLVQGDIGDSRDWEEVCALENSLRVVLDESLVGTLKTSRATDGFCHFKITGPSADTIHRAIQRTLATSRLAPSGYLVLRYADGREPVKLPLCAANFFVRYFKKPMSVGLGVIAGLVALGLHNTLAVPERSPGEALRLPPLEHWLLLLEAGAVFLGVGFYVGRWVARWVGDHYSDMVMKHRSSAYLRGINGAFGVLLVLTRGVMMQYRHHAGWEDVAMLLLGVFLVLHVIKQHLREARE